MDKKLQQDLFLKYPRIFKNLSQAHEGLPHDIAIKNGWYHILDALCGAVSRYVENMNQRIGITQFNIVAIRIKERYAGLVFDYEGIGDQYVDGMIRMAEFMSRQTCEVCGAPGEVREGDWLCIRCDQHKFDG